MNSFKSDRFFNTCQGRGARKTNQLSWESLPHPWTWAPLSSGLSDSWVTRPGNQEQHGMSAQALLSGDQNGASHHFQSVPLNYFADRLLCLVLWFLILRLTQRKRERERERERERKGGEEEREAGRKRENANTGRTTPNTSIIPLHLAGRSSTKAPSLGFLSPCFGGGNGEPILSWPPFTLHLSLPPRLGVVGLC